MVAKDINMHLGGLINSGDLANLANKGLGPHAYKSGAKLLISEKILLSGLNNGYSMQEDALFEVHLTKARGVPGEEVKPFEAQLVEEDNTLLWKKRDIEEAELGQLKKHLENGLSIREIAEEMGKSKSAIHRLKNKI